MSKIGILYYLKNNKLSTKKKIEFLTPFYIRKNGHIPEFVLVNPEQIGDLRNLEFPVSEIKKEVSLEVISDKGMLKNHFMIGIEEEKEKFNE